MTKHQFPRHGTTTAHGFKWCGGSGKPAANTITGRGLNGRLRTDQYCPKCRCVITITSGGN